MARSACCVRGRLDVVVIDQRDPEQGRCGKFVIMAGGVRAAQQIHGAGAFRRFKDTLARHNLLDTWFAYRQAAFAEIAIEWLDEHHIPYVRDERNVRR